MDAELPKVRDVLKRLEDRAVQFGREIDLAFGTIVKANPDGVCGNVASICDVRQHGANPMGRCAEGGILAGEERR